MKSLRDVLEKLPVISKRVLREVVFDLNNHRAADDSGSPAERFLKRGIRSRLPNSCRKDLESEDLMAIRAKKQRLVAERKGRKSADEFKLGDRVRVQDVATKKWNKSGVVQEAREADDGQSVSFIIKMDNGNESIRHRTHLKHDVTREDRASPIRIRFIEEDAKTDGKVQDPDSDTDTDSTPDSSEKENSTVGVTTRSMAKLHEPCPESAAPTKSSLRKKSQ